MVPPLVGMVQRATAGRRIEYSLALLQVASQIEFHKLMDSISRYWACIKWTPKDEIRIREYSTSPGFSRGHAEDLVERLGLDGSEEDRQKQLRDFIQQLVRTALEPNLMLRSEPARVFLKVVLEDSYGPSSSSFARVVATVVTREAKYMLHNLVDESRSIDRYRSNTFREKLIALCWMLDALLTTQVPEDLLKSFAHADGLKARILSKGLENKVQELVFHMYEAVARGRLLFNTKERLALLVIWLPVLKLKEPNTDIDHVRATETLFETLPIKMQMVLIQQHPEFIDQCIGSCNLLRTVSKGRDWQAIELQDVDASSLANDDAGTQKQVAE